MTLINNDSQGRDIVVAVGTVLGNQTPLAFPTAAAAVTAAKDPLLRRAVMTSLILLAIDLTIGGTPVTFKFTGQSAEDFLRNIADNNIVI